MKIAFIRKKYTGYGGAEAYLLRLIKEVRNLGHEVHLFSKERGKSKEEIFFHRVNVIRGFSFLEVLSFAVCSCRKLKREDFDVIFSLERVFYQDIYRAGDGCHREWLRRRESIVSPLKRWLTCINPLHRSLLYLEKRLLQDKKLTAIIANSQRVKDDIIKHYGVPSSKIEVVYNGIDIDQYSLNSKEKCRQEIRKEYGIDENNLLLLFVGSGFERKGLGYLLTALSLSNDDSEKIRLLVVGKGNIKKYKNVARKLNIEEKIRFSGPKKETAAFYLASDLFILPSIYEPFSNSCLEAMASGLPVITSAVNGASEIIKESESGYVLMDPTDETELKEKISLLLDPEKRKQFGSKSRMIAESFTIQKNVKETLGIINRLKD